MKTAYISHQDCQLHNMGSDHPESPARIAAITQQLENSRLLRELKVIEAEPVDLSCIERAHPSSYVHKMINLRPTAGGIYVDPDTLMIPQTMRAAMLGAGAVVQAVDGVLSDQFRAAFCAIRPPGHHAQREKAMGFCFFNNIAIAAKHALEVHGLERIAIVDFDVHQGNGTIDIFADDPRVLVCSSFQHPFYPYSHYDVDRPHIINSPLAAYSGGSAFRQKVEHDWLDRLQAHKPQLILVSAGFDAHRADPLGQINLDVTDYRWVTEMIMSVAYSYCSGRVVSILEGGYDLKALAQSAQAHIEVLATDRTWKHPPVRLQDIDSV